MKQLEEKFYSEFTDEQGLNFKSDLRPRYVWSFFKRALEEVEKENKDRFILERMAENARWLLKDKIQNSEFKKMLVKRNAELKSQLKGG